MIRLAPVLLLAAALIGADEVPPAAVPAPTLALSARGGTRLSMAPDRPSEAVGGVTLRYEQIVLEGDRLSYRLSKFPGASRPVLLNAEIAGGPAGPADGRVLLDSSASKLPQVAFRGVMRPRTVVVTRRDPDPAAPTAVRFDAAIDDLGDMQGLLQTDKGERQHIAWAEKAVLRYVATIDPAAAMGMGTPRLTDIYLYGRPASDGVAARPAVVLRMPKPVPAAEATVETQLAAGKYGMRGAGRAISIFFDADGKLERIEGVDDYELKDGEDSPFGGGQGKPGNGHAKPGK